MLQVLKKENKNTSNLFEYSIIEKKIIDIINQYDNITLNEIVKKIDMQRHRIIHSLAKLIYFKIISINNEHKDERYTLKTEN